MADEVTKKSLTEQESKAKTAAPVVGKQRTTSSKASSAEKPAAPKRQTPDQREAADIKKMEDAQAKHEKQRAADDAASQANADQAKHDFQAGVRNAEQQAVDRRAELEARIKDKKGKGLTPDEQKFVQQVAEEEAMAK